MSTPEHAMTTYVSMWNARDEDARRRFAEHVLTDDAALIYPTIEAHGRENIVAAIGRFQEQMPGAHFEAISGIERHHGWLRESWHLIQIDGTVRLEGEDVVELAEDGRFRRVIGFRNPLPPRS